MGVSLACLKVPLNLNISVLVDVLKIKKAIHLMNCFFID